MKRIRKWISILILHQRAVHIITLFNGIKIVYEWYTIAEVPSLGWMEVTEYSIECDEPYAEYYYLYSVCESPGGGGYPGDPNSNENPIQTANSPCGYMEAQTYDTEFRIIMSELSGYSSSNGNELGFLLDLNEDYEELETIYDYEPIYGSSGSINLSDFLYGGQCVDGMMHTHTQSLVPMFSAEDILAIKFLYDNGYINNLSKFTSVLANGADLSSYNLLIDNPYSFITFCDNHLNTQEKIDTFNQNVAMAQGLGSLGLMTVFLQETEGSGITLFKSDNVDFTHWTRKTLNQNQSLVVSNPCY